MTVILLMRYGYVETTSNGCLLLGYQTRDFPTVNDALKKIGEVCLKYYSNLPKEDSRKIIEDNFRGLFGSDYQDDYSNDLFEAGFDLCPERNLKDFSTLVLIDQHAEAIVADATLDGGLEYANKDHLSPDKFWWERVISVPKGIKIY